MQEQKRTSPLLSSPLCLAPCRTADTEGRPNNLRQLQSSSPFCPLFKIKGLTFASTKRVACEPTVPGETVMHFTTSTFGIVLWLMPWSVGRGEWDGAGQG